MTRVTDSTSIDNPKIDCDAVPAGSKMFVGDHAIPLPASRDEEYTTASVARSDNTVTSTRSATAEQELPGF
jgi:BRCT domain type II-containing protein